MEAERDGAKQKRNPAVCRALLKARRNSQVFCFSRLEAIKTILIFSHLPFAPSLAALDEPRVASKPIMQGTYNIRRRLRSGMQERLGFALR